jgi:hypothetical protein
LEIGILLEKQFQNCRKIKTIAARYSQEIFICKRLSCGRSLLELQRAIFGIDFFKDILRVDVSGLHLVLGRQNIYSAAAWDSNGRQKPSDSAPERTYLL